MTHPAGAARTAKIDVLIPVYNVETTVREAVTSILTQDERDIRVIIVDDGSTDGTRGILRGLAAQDERVEVLTKPNGGIVDALNLGLAHATAEFIARHDGDDIAFPNRFSDQLRFLKLNPHVVAVSSNTHMIDSLGRRTGLDSNQGDISEASPYTAPSNEPFLSHPFLMVRREAVEKVGRYRHIFHAEDVDLYWRLQHHGTLINLATIHGCYRQHEASVTNRSIVNGRVAALNAQIAAVSEQRRRAASPDLTLSKNLLARYVAAEHLEAMMEIAMETGLTAREADYVRVATAAKLLSATEYRPYELSLEDCRFIRDCRGRLEGLPQGTAQVMRFLVTQSGRRLLRKGQRRECAALVPAALFPRMLVQMARATLPRSLSR